MNIIDPVTRMNATETILNSFESLTLKELDVVRLLDRIDTKYIFNLVKLPAVLADLAGDFRILDMNGTRQSCYQTIYFDTDDLSMYHHHHNGRATRYKVRIRRYCDSDVNFLEIKHRNNKGRTIKSRIRKNEFTTDLEENACLFLKTTPFLPENLKPVLQVDYKRITFAGKDHSTRLTLDTGIRFSYVDRRKSFEPLVIAEVKQSRSSRSRFHVLMRNHGIPELSLSKYCLGIASLYDGIRMNNFKEKLLRIHKVIQHEN